MARVDIKAPREQAAHFGLYRTSAGGQQFIIVRRKVGEPTDTAHANSRKLKRQRDNLSLASQHYSRLTPSQKAITRHQIEEVEYQKSHGKTDTKILLGRQLFIAKEMRSLATKGKQLVLPLELCIILVDENGEILQGELWLHYQSGESWLEAGKERLSKGNWLFSQVPAAMSAYRPYGEAEGYIDEQLEAYQFMTEEEIRAYHYHALHSYVPILNFTGANTHAFSCSEGRRAAQTFAFSGQTILKGVVLRCFLFNPAYNGTIYITLQGTIGGKPDGINLVQGQRRLSALVSQPKNLIIWLPDYTLAPDTRYAIVAHVIMDKPYPHTDSLRIQLLDEQYPHLPYRGFYSYEPTGSGWLSFPFDYCYWMILLG